MQARRLSSILRPLRARRFVNALATQSANSNDAVDHGDGMNGHVGKQPFITGSAKRQT